MTGDLVPLLHQLLVAAQQVNAHHRAGAKMTASEYAGLQHLAHSENGLTPGQLGERLALTSGSVTKLVDRLERRRLVRRVRPSNADRRSVTVVATSAGEALIDRDIRAILDSPNAPGSPTQIQRDAALSLLAYLGMSTPARPSLREDRSGR